MKDKEVEDRRGGERMGEEDFGEGEAKEKRKRRTRMEEEARE